MYSADIFTRNYYLLTQIQGSSTETSFLNQLPFSQNLLKFVMGRLKLLEIIGHFVFHKYLTVQCLRDSISSIQSWTDFQHWNSLVSPSFLIPFHITDLHLTTKIWPNFHARLFTRVASEASGTSLFLQGGSYSPELSVCVSVCLKPPCISSSTERILIIFFLKDAQWKVRKEPFWNFSENFLGAVSAPMTSYAETWKILELHSQL